MPIEKPFQSILGFVALLILLLSSTAFAMDRAAWFQSLRVPGTQVSCCEIADCQRTEAELRAGSWWALVDKKWRQIPQFTVLSHPASLDGSAYVCVGLPAGSIGMRDPPIQCFVPPDWQS